MRYLMGAIAIAPFAGMLMFMVSVATGRAHVRACCAPASRLESGSETGQREAHRVEGPPAPERPASRPRGETVAASIGQATAVS